VDFTPNVHAPINFLTGACQRIGRAQEYIRNLATRWFDGVDTHIIPRTAQGNRVYNQYVRNILAWSNHVRLHMDELFSFNPYPSYSLEDWLSHSSYNECRKAKIRAQSDIPSDYYRVETFIKKEAYPEIKAPRLINSREDGFKKLVGPFTHAIEKDIFSSRFTIKGKNARDQIAIIHDRLSGKKSFLSTDYSKWESSITPEVIDHIESLLWSKYPSPYGWDFHTWFNHHCKNNNLFARGKMSCKVHGVRMSGDMHTSLGNTFINIMLTDYILTTLGLTWDGFFEGDDGLIGLDVVVSDQQLQAISNMALSLGFSLTMERAYHLSDAVFLSRHIVDQQTAFRDPIKALVHAQWSFSLHRFPEEELLRSRGYGLIMENPRCPILYELGVAMIQVAGSGRVHCDQWYKDYFGIPDVVSSKGYYDFPTPVDRQTFHRLFGISVGTQCMVEDAIRARDWPRVNELLTRLVKEHQPSWVVNYFNVREFVKVLDHFNYDDH